MRKLLVIWGVLVALNALSVSALYANPDEILIEEQIATRLQRSLDTIYGSGNFVVRVDVSLSAPSYQVRYTGPARVAAPESKTQAKVNILPGYPVIRNLGPENTKQVPFDSVTNYTRSVVQSTSIYLLVNKSFPKSQVGRAQAIVKELVDFNAGRDRLEVTYKPFIEQSEPVQKIEIASQSENMFSFQNIFYSLFAVLALIFMVIYVVFSSKMSRSLVGLSALSGGGSGGGGAAPSVSVNPSFELPKGGSGGDIKISNAAPVKKYFDFVSEDTIDKLIYLLQKENVGPDNLSLIVSFLRPDLAALLLSKFDSKTQASIAMAILDSKMVNRAMIDKLETQIKGALECLTGGESTFKSVFSFISSQNKKQVMDILEKASPEGYRRVRNNVILFEDLARLEDDEIKVLLAEIRTELFAVALASADTDVFDRFDRNMTRNAKDIVSQFLEIKGANIAADEIEKAQQSILESVVRLEREGRVNISAKLKK